MHTLRAWPVLVLLACSKTVLPEPVDTDIDTDTLGDSLEDTGSETDLPPDTDVPDTDVPDTDDSDTDVPDTDDSDPDTGTPPPACDRPAGFAPVFASERAMDPLGMMMSVWGTAADDVWVVGGQKFGDGFALHGTHDAFTTVALPSGTPMLNWVNGTAADDVWVGGVDGTLLHYDGATWTNHDLPEAGAIWGVHARSTDDVLAVGGPFFGVGTAFAYRYDGTDWSPVTLPPTVPTSGSLFKTAGTDDGYLVVGQGGQSLVVDDAGARGVPTGTGDDLVTISVDADRCHEPVAVGGLFAGGMWRYVDEATGWSSVATAFFKLNGVHALGDGSFVAVGDRGGVGWWDATTSTWNQGTPFTTDLLHATWVAPNGDAYAVGGNFLTSGPTFHGALGFAPGPP